MKRTRRYIAVVIAVIISFSLVAPLSVEAAQVEGRNITSRAAIVVDFETGIELFEHNADEQRVPASLTKLLAAYVVYDAIRAGELRLNSGVRISRSTSEFSRDWEYSNVPLSEGSSVPVSQLLEVVLIRSACAATVALGEAVSGSESAFVTRMNRKAAQLGITCHFYDCYGGSPDNRISARGLAVLSRTLIHDFPEILNITSKRNVTFNGTTYNSSNLLLGNYTGLDGLKTGFTDPAGYCFVGTAQRNGRRLISVTLGSTLESRYPDTRVLLDYGFASAERIISEHASIKMAEPSSANLIINGAATPLTAYIIDELHYFKLRDVAYLLSNTGNRFEVAWSDADKTASITSGLPYTSIGGEMRAAADGARAYIPTTSSIIVNGQARSLEAYLIDNSNYFKLRDLGDLLGFDVGWVQETRTVIINTASVSNGAQPDAGGFGDLAGLFFDVIADLIATDLFLDTSIEILAFDFLELNYLSETEKTTLLRRVSEAFGFQTVQAAIDELYEQGLISRGVVYFQRGLLFTFTNIDAVSDAELVFSISIWRGSQSTNLFVDYNAVKSDGGSWNFTSDLGE